MPFPLSFIEKYKWIIQELKYLNKLAVVGASNYFCDAIQFKMGTIFISRTSGDEISEKVSALYLGQTIIYFTAYVTVQGITTGMNTLCSQAYGTKNHKLVGMYYTRALFIAALTCFPLWSLWIKVGPLVHYLSGDMLIAEGAGQYTMIFCFGYPAYIYYKLTNGFLLSQNIAYPILAIVIMGNCLNVFLQWLLVVVIPLEVTGAALSYVISTYIIALLLYMYVRMTEVHIRNYNDWSFEFLTGWCHFLKYGVACIGQVLLDVAVTRIIPIAFIGFILRDTNQLALLGVLNTVWNIFTVASYGYGVGALIRIGNLLGENNVAQAKRATVLSMWYMVLIVSLFGVIIFVSANWLSYIFTSVEEMRVQIEFGVKIISVGILSDISVVTRAICNACCLQLYTTIIEFILFTLLTIPLCCLFVYYISWKASGYYLILSLGLLITSIIESLLLYFYNWEYIAKKVSRNTTSSENSNLAPMSFTTSDTQRLQTRTYHHKNMFLFIRYLIVLLFGTILFVSAILFD